VMLLAMLMDRLSVLTAEHTWYVNSNLHWNGTLRCTVILFEFM